MMWLHDETNWNINIMKWYRIDSTLIFNLMGFRFGKNMIKRKWEESFSPLFIYKKKKKTDFCSSTHFHKLKIHRWSNSHFDYNSIIRLASISISFFHLLFHSPAFFFFFCINSFFVFVFDSVTEHTNHTNILSIHFYFSFNSSSSDGISI